jgi:outer membrane protein insertion porin family
MLSGGNLFPIKRTIYLLVFASIALLGGFSAFADNDIISEVIVSGNKLTDSAAILRVVKSKSGEALSPEKVNQDVKDIYNLGRFEDVRAETEKTAKGTVLTYFVSERSIVREIRISGNKEINTEKIRAAIELKTNSIYSAKELANSIKKVRKLYTDDGYYLAEVTATPEKRAGNEIRIVFRINEGNKVLIKTITFEGNKFFSARKLRGFMQTKQKWFLSWITSAGTYKEDILKNDVNIIADHYYNNGYVNVKVGEPQVKLLADKSGLLVTISIVEGDQFKTGSLDFKGDLLEQKEVLAKKVKLVPGQVFSRAVLREDVFALTDLYADKGYAFTNVSPLSKIDPDKKTVDITFDFEKGDKVYIERINITGNSKTRDKVVRREFKLAEGSLYSSTALKKTKQNINNLGFFEEINISQAKGSADNKLNLNAEVKEKSTGTFSIGGGYSSLDGIIGQASVQQSNFLGLGLKAVLSGSLGGKTQTYTLGLTDPYFLDTKWTLGGDIYRSDRDYIDFTRRVTGADIKGGYPLTDELNTFWMYKYEVKDIFNLSTALNDNPNLLTESSGKLSSLYGSLTLNTTDYRLDPSKGFVGTLSAEYAGIGGDQKFVRFIGESAYFIPFKWNTVFSLRGTMGYIMRNGNDISIDEKFFLGGINTLRGFSSRSVSPFVNVATHSIENGLVTPGTTNVFLGGTKEAIFNAEYVFPIIKEANIKGLVFVDAGNAYGPGQSFFSTVRASYGLGFRWYSPMGPLRLEYGIPVNPRPGIDNKSGKLEFSIGGFF